MRTQLDMFDIAGGASSSVPAARSKAKSAPASEDMARQLEASGDFRVLRRLPHRESAAEPSVGFPYTAVIVDTETTGLDHTIHEVIEIGLIAVGFDAAGNIGEVIATYNGLQQPQEPVPAEITKLTGITDEMVEGQTIDLAAVSQIVASADIVIAHNARFDRPFCEALCKGFSDRAWACSVTEIDWADHGYEGTKLAYLLGQAGYFHDGHRALDDCFALLQVLSVEDDERSAFSELWTNSHKTRVRVYAEHAPYEMKDRLRAKGYRWSDGQNGTPRAWWLDLDEDLLADELQFLRTEIYGWDEAEPAMHRLTAFERFKA